MYSFERWCWCCVFNRCVDLEYIDRKLRRKKLFWEEYARTADSNTSIRLFIQYMRLAIINRIKSIFNATEWNIRGHICCACVLMALAALSVESAMGIAKNTFVIANSRSPSLRLLNCGLKPLLNYDHTTRLQLAHTNSFSFCTFNGEDV